MQIPAKGVIDYQSLLRAAGQSPEGIIKFLGEELPSIWRDAYIEMSPHPVNIVRWQYGSFEYIFDDYASLESRGMVPCTADVEGRLIAVLSCSSPKTTKRDDYRLKGWVGAAERYSGRDGTKGISSRTRSGAWSMD